MKNNKAMIKYAKSLGINLTIDPALSKKHNGRIVAPEKLEEARKVLLNLKFLPQ